MRCAKLLFSLPALTLIGCATNLSMTYRSDPPGAMLYENGRAVGYTPQTLNYTPTEHFKRGACMNLRAVSVRWISGVETSPTQTKACGSVGYIQELTFVRPAGLAGHDLLTTAIMPAPYPQERRNTREDCEILHRMLIPLRYARVINLPSELYSH